MSVIVYWSVSSLHRLLSVELHHFIRVYFWRLLYPVMPLQLLIWVCIFQPFTACWNAAKFTQPVLSSPCCICNVILPAFYSIYADGLLPEHWYWHLVKQERVITLLWNNNTCFILLNVKYTYRQTLVLCLLIIDGYTNYGCFSSDRERLIVCLCNIVLETVGVTALQGKAQTGLSHAGWKVSSGSVKGSKWVRVERCIKSFS